MPKNLIPALVLIVLGVIFLLNNLGYTNLGLGQLIATWWPLILIVAGLSMLFRRR